MKLKLNSLKKINRGLILSQLSKKNLTRVELQKCTGISAGSVSSIIKELINSKVILESEIVSSNKLGRKGVYLLLNPEYKFIIGIKIKRGSLIATLNDLNGKIFKEIVFEIEDTNIDTLVTLINKIYLKFSKNKPIIGLGIVLPAQVNPVTKTINYSSFYQWKDIPLGDLLKNKINIPIFIENDVRAMTLAEKNIFNSELKNILFINIDNGISTGICINNELFLGDNFIAGQIGHSYVKNNNILCKCGKYGCLETVIANPYLLKKYIKNSKLNDKNITFDTFLHEINKGNKIALNILEEASLSLAIVLGNLLNTFNISNVIIGGDLSKNKKLFFQLLTNNLSKICLPIIFKNLNLSRSKLNHKNNTIGAVTIVSHNFFKGNII